jgi:hypothetical protein
VVWAEARRRAALARARLSASLRDRPAARTSRPSATGPAKIAAKQLPELINILTVSVQRDLLSDGNREPKGITAR